VKGGKGNERSSSLNGNYMAGRLEQEYMAFSGRAVKRAVFVHDVTF
jgi:hypothetical protein